MMVLGNGKQDLLNMDELSDLWLYDMEDDGILGSLLSLLN
jgi:hypothetical protein